MKKIILASLLISLSVVGAIGFGEHIRAESEIVEAPKDVVAAVRPDQLLTVLDSDVVLGDAAALLTIIEYASLSCSHCAKFHKTVVPVLKEKYINTGKVKYILRNFPLNGPAFRGALLMECVDDSKYYAFAEVLFAQQDKWAFSSGFIDDLKKIAGLGGVSEEQFSKCMDDETAKAAILNRVKNADEVLQINSTPTTFVGAERIEGASSPEEVSKIVEKQLDLLEQ